MKVLRHRSNTVEDIERIALFDGLELDIRMNDLGIVVVEHHPGENGPNPLSLVGYLSCVAAVEQRLGVSAFLAVNVKCNGLVPELKPILAGRDNYFLFDVPGEELGEYTQGGLKVFGRWSEDDQQRPIDGVVIDCIHGQYDAFQIAQNDSFFVGNEFAIIGEDLRGRTPLSLQMLEKLQCSYLITKQAPVR
jgi:hypothetical protein